MVKANMFQVKVAVKSFYLYDVKFEPKIDPTMSDYNRKCRRALSKHRRALYASFSQFYSFDGGAVLVSHVERKEPLALAAPGDDGNEVKTTITLAREVKYDASGSEQVFLQMANLVFQKFLRQSEFQRFGRAFFHPKATEFRAGNMRLNMHRGFKATMVLTQTGPMLLCDSVPLLVRVQTVRERMDDIARSVSRRLSNADTKTREMEVQRAIHEELSGSRVMTAYNSRVYRIARVDWAMSADSKFSLKDGSQTSFYEYYQRYGDACQRRIQKGKDGLLQVDRNRRGVEEQDTIYLIPELCRLVGLGEDAAANDPRGNLAQDIGRMTKMPPGERIDLISQMIRQLTVGGVKVPGKGGGAASAGSRGSATTTEAPPLLIESKCVEFKTDVLGPYEVIVPQRIESRGRDVNVPTRTIQVGATANDFNTQLRSMSVLAPHEGFTLGKVAVVCTRQDERLAREFVEKAFNLGRNVGLDAYMRKDYFRVFAMDASRPRDSDWVDHIRRVADQRPDIVFILVPRANNEATYNAVKHACVHITGLISQCIKAENINDRRASIVISNTLKQAFCKRGCKGWQIKWDPDLKGLVDTGPTMLCGVDSTRKKVRGRAAVSVVGTCDASFSKYISRSRSIREGDDQGQNALIVAQLIGELAEQFRAKNGADVKNLVLYRQGMPVFEAEDTARAEYHAIFNELKKINQARRATDEKAPEIAMKITYVIVVKGPNNRFFRTEQGGRGDLVDSPYPGTVVSGKAPVSPGNLHQFFLIPTKPHRNQGTATPVRYTVIADEVFPEDQARKLIPKLTYQLCYMYFNWAGSIRVPAPLQYASKLTRMVTEHVGDIPEKKLHESEGLWMS